MAAPSAPSTTAPINRAHSSGANGAHHAPTKNVVKAHLNSDKDIIVSVQESSCAPPRRRPAHLAAAAAQTSTPFATQLAVPDVRTQVIKVGTSSLVRPEQQTLNLSNLARICETIKTLHLQGAPPRRTPAVAAKQRWCSSVQSAAGAS